MKSLVVANWKMNPQTPKEAEELFRSIEGKTQGVEGVEVVICPPAIYLPLMIQRNYCSLGGQNCFWLEKGAYTGEISSLMLKNSYCKYVIIGHSERRIDLAETDGVVNMKIITALKAGLNPIVCVGETAVEREEGRAIARVEDQIERAFEDISSEDFLQVGSVNIAYEPIWAIGTGNPCDSKTALEMRLVAVERIKSLFKEKVATFRFLYGGSANVENAESFIKEAGYDGLLVGGASLRPDEFNRIVKIVSSVRKI
ncbi:MAG: triose-phosphate isomerase [bacterium]